MSKFIKQTKSVEIVDLSNNELFSLMKINVPVILSFKKGTEIIDYLILTDRLNELGEHKIVVSDIFEKNKSVTYSTLFEMVSERMKLGILSAQIEKSDFQAKEPLLLMLESLNQSLISSCIYIDYDSKKHIYTVMNKENKGVSDKLYYFEDNDSILAFGENGPVLVYGKTQSIEDVICE